MELQIDKKTTIASGAFGSSAPQLAMRLEGRKNWLSVSRLAFETTQHNISLVLSMHPGAEIKDLRAVLEEEVETLPDPEPRFVMEPRDFQLRNFERFKNQQQWAIFSEQGTGKTKVAIDIICHRYLKRTVSGVLILSSPKGVHAQWINEQLPKHLWEGVKTRTYIWGDKKEPTWLGNSTEELQIFSGNIDMLKSEKGFVALDKFARVHRQRLLIIVDESDSIKNISAQRSKKLRQLAGYTLQRGIMTGTPIAKDLTDEWAQFFFLNPDIIGNKYLTSFRAQYCIMGGFENRSVVGHRNIERFKDLVAPYIFRATKAELDLPPKVYDEVVFDLSLEQKTMIRSIRDTFFADLGNGQELSVKNGATALLRIQQISNGFSFADDGQSLVELKENPRMKALEQLRRDIQGKVIIWCRFKQDVKTLLQSFNGSVSIYGENTGEERSEAKEEFISGGADELIATPGAAGKGVDGLQRVCSTAIYYSNSFNAIDRWQSEDRIDRIGMIGTSSYFDLIARGSCDRGILTNLKRKKDISSLALGDIIEIMEQM